MATEREKIMKKPASHQIQVTLSDLLAAAGEVAFECSNNDKEGFDFAQFALIEILKNSTVSSDKDFESLSSPSTLLH